MSSRGWFCSYSIQQDVNAAAVVVRAVDAACDPQPSGLTSLPPELLRNVLRRVESDAESWPARKDVVACSAVCKTWRSIIQELVKTPDVSGELTFPISLKQPGHREKPMQCFIKRDKLASMFYLHLGLAPARLADESSKFLMAARKYSHTSSIEYIISLKSDDISTYSNEFMGKLRSNFLGTKFRLYDTYPPNNMVGIAWSTGMLTRWSSKQVWPKTPIQNYNVGQIRYMWNIFGSRRPRRMICTMHSTPMSVTQVGGHASTLDEASRHMHSESSSRSSRNKSQKTKYGTAPLVFQNKAPRWHEQLQCWCLNFRGRVSVSSVKNFQLVAVAETNPILPQSDRNKVVLQFGKIGKDIFTMDYWYPLSAYQAFAICLTCFGMKPACE